MKRYLLFGFVCMFVSLSVHATCTMKYECGSGATGTAPAQQTVSSGTTYTPVAPDTCTKDGYVFSHYIVTPSSYSYVDAGVAKPGVTYNIPFTTTRKCNSSFTFTFTAQWVPANMTVPTSKAYVDTALAGKQPNFANYGSDKLMLYSDTTDGAVLSRDIVTTLGTPNSTTGIYSDTTSDTVPTKGAVSTGIKRKQNRITGLANWVTTYTGNDGVVGSKPIYNNTDQYGDSLIEAATLNTAVVNAVNSELTQIDENGNESSSGTLWRLNDVSDLTTLVTRLSPVPNGTGVCYRGISEEDNENSGCDASYYSALPRGQWRAIFDYGNVDGNAVCSNVAPDLYTLGNVPNSTKQETIGGQWSTWVENNRPTTLSDGYLHCYCQMTSPAGSSWVLQGSNGVSAVCASDCADDCVSYVQGNAAFRRAMFGSVAQ